MKSMAMDPPMMAERDSFLGHLTKWFQSSTVENPQDGMELFFAEFRPQDDIVWRMGNMWYVMKHKQKHSSIYKWFASVKNI